MTSFNIILIRHSKSTLLMLFFMFVTISYSQNKDWDQKESILKGITVPTFKNATYTILNYGAVGDGVQDNTNAFKAAIKACSKNGGGTVLVPKGKFYTTPIHLEDNINLHISEGAEIIFSTNPEDFPIVHTSFEGTELMNYSPLIYAYGKKNIAITGKGVLNGQASKSNWWGWCGKETYGWTKGTPSQNDKTNRFRLVALAEQNIPVKERIFGKGGYLRPNFIQFFECNTALIEGITIINAPFWVLHPIKSQNVIIDGVTIDSHGPNNDGCDPEYSKNVWIKNSTFNTGDDCIAIKSGRDADGRRVALASENIVIENCKMIDGHGGVVIGSEISGGVHHVFVENCEMNSPNLDRAIRIKTNTDRGGITENIFVRNLKVGQVKEAFLKLNMKYSIYEGDQSGKYMPTIRNVFIENVTVENGGKFGILADGYEASPIQNISLTNVTIDHAQQNYSLKNVKNIIFTNTTINGVQIKN
ncbi:glycoside hydrolase family 28 protein [Flavobacterium sp. RSSA_27]|uniref:glycoside hydrolase family 28 protein n=1 Tax=Flavobacterium sp. RSSA_27 TaxID=3447667 RepID=UPI003F31C8B8